MILYGVVVSSPPGKRYLMENHPPVKVAPLKMVARPTEVAGIGRERSGKGRAGRVGGWGKRCKYIENTKERNREGMSEGIS